MGIIIGQHSIVTKRRLKLKLPLVDIFLCEKYCFCAIYKFLMLKHILLHWTIILLLSVLS
jgi:hypothetical protein